MLVARLLWNFVQVSSIWTATHPSTAAYRPRLPRTTPAGQYSLGRRTWQNRQRRRCKRTHGGRSNQQRLDPKPGKIEKLCETLEKLNLTEFDTVVIDSMLNSAHVGTDEDGLPIPAEKSDEDGRYHLYGNLQLAPPSAFKNCLKHMEKMLAFVGDAKVVFVIPLPRYVLSGCCADTEHVSNRLSGELAAEFAGAEKCLREAADLGQKTGKARLLNILSFFGSCESPPQDLTTVDGTSI
jgi:hypothetical protein